MHLQNSPLDLNLVLSEIHEPEAGAMVVFMGRTRIHNHGKEVSYLEYEAYPPMAEKMITEILETAIREYGLCSAYCIHRLGRVNLKEVSILVVTVSGHRGEGYEANRYILDRVKHEVPIWKHEFYTDGTETWVENCKHHSND
ncbi:MAG: molybdenum cofactor biosynthesis protein MoaE [Leptospiraceae bacterium]|nr:molybdenum cofactor biosynthesis protein MoaE [Leptospiraceae bacterium]MCP5495579.1 molybdenum cofactor biosynthesis protein MoaE [Leptospiraceae bacterium]